MEVRSEKKKTMEIVLMIESLFTFLFAFTNDIHLKKSANSKQSVYIND